jgi:hypothetical protein
MDAMDATGHDVVEGGAHRFEYDLDDPGRVTRRPLVVPGATTAATGSRSPRRPAKVGASRRRHEKEP